MGKPVVTDPDSESPFLSLFSKLRKDFCPTLSKSKSSPVPQDSLSLVKSYIIYLKSIIETISHHHDPNFSISNLNQIYASLQHISLVPSVLGSLRLKPTPKPGLIRRLRQYNSDDQAYYYFLSLYSPGRGVPREVWHWGVFP